MITASIFLTRVKAEDIEDLQIPEGLEGKLGAFKVCVFDTDRETKTSFYGAVTSLEAIDRTLYSTLTRLADALSIAGEQPIPEKPLISTETIIPENLVGLNKLGPAQ